MRSGPHCTCLDRDRIFVAGHGVEEPDAGGPAEGAGAASGKQPAGEGSLSQEPALAAPAAGQQDLGADGAAGHPGQAPPEQLEQRRHTSASPASAQRTHQPHVSHHSSDHLNSFPTCARLRVERSMFTHDAFTVHTLRLGTRLQTSQGYLDHAFPSIPLEFS